MLLCNICYAHNNTSSANSGATIDRGPDKIDGCPDGDYACVTRYKLCFRRAFENEKMPAFCKEFEVTREAYEEQLYREMPLWKRILQYITSSSGQEEGIGLTYCILLLMLQVIIFVLVFLFVSENLFRILVKVEKSEADYMNMYTANKFMVYVYLSSLVCLLLTVNLIFAYIVNSYIYFGVDIVLTLLESVIVFKQLPIYHLIYIQNQPKFESNVQFDVLFTNNRTWYGRLLHNIIQIIPGVGQRYLQQLDQNDKYVAYNQPQNRAVALPESMLLRDSSYLDTLLSKIYDSNDVSRSLRIELQRLSLGSLYILGERFLHWRRSNIHNRNRYDANHVRHVEFNEIRFNNNVVPTLNQALRNLQSNSISDRLYIASVYKVVYECARHANGNAVFVQNVFNNHGNYYQMMSQRGDLFATSWKLSIYDQTLYPVYYFTTGKRNDIIVEIVKLNDEGYEQVQFYNRNALKLDVKTRKVKGNVVIKTDDYLNLIEKLKQISADLTYEHCEQAVPHSHSHYISKVMHTRVLNSCLKVGTYKKVLDVGSSFCDVTLGHGVQYNTAIVENQDDNRIEKSIERVIQYLEYNTENITVYHGDVLKYDFSQTQIDTVLMHNCCYNIDLVKMIEMLNYSKISKLINSTQVQLDVIKGYETETSYNEMQWRMECRENSSILTSSNLVLTGVTEVSTYQHHLSVLSDWYTKCSIKLKHLNNEYVWNQECIEAKYGYYVHLWNSSEVMKESDVLRQNDNFHDLMLITTDFVSHKMIHATRIKCSNIEDKSFYTALTDRTRSERERQIYVNLANHMKMDTQVETMDNVEWSSLFWMFEKREVLIYRTVDVSVKQVPAYVKINGIQVDHERIWYKCEDEEEIDVNLFKQSVNEMNFVMFKNFLEKSNLKVNIYFEIENYYYFVQQSMRYSNVNMVYLITSNGIQENKYSDNVIKNKLKIEKLYDKIISVYYQQSCEKKEFLKGKTFEQVVHQIIDRKFCDITVLDVKQEVEDELVKGVRLNTKIEADRLMQDNKNEHINNIIQRQNGRRNGNAAAAPARMQRNAIAAIAENDLEVHEKKTKYKRKEYVLPKKNDANKNEIDEALLSGKLKNNHVNGIAIIDVDTGEYYDPFDMLQMHVDGQGNMILVGMHDDVDILDHDMNQVNMEYYQNNLQRNNVNNVNIYRNNGIVIVRHNDRVEYYQHSDAFVGFAYQHYMNVNQNLKNIVLF